MAKKKKLKTLKGGTFNLRYGRKVGIVENEVTGLLQKHDLDFLCVQEAKEYTKNLRKIDGYRYFVDTSRQGSNECGILVKNQLVAEKFKPHFYGDGWTRRGGGSHAPTVQAEVKIDGWLWVRSIHLNAGTNWVNGKLQLPPERFDDYVASVRGIVRFFRWPATRNARAVIGDWNEHPETRGAYAPRTIADQVKARNYAPVQRQGHGIIDWAMVKGAVITNIFKDLKFNEKSDHEPVIFTITKK